MSGVKGTAFGTLNLSLKKSFLGSLKRFELVSMSERVRIN